MKTITKSIAMAVLASAVTVAYAQAPGGGMGKGRNMPAFTDFDLNADGYLVEDEFYEARNLRISERAKQGYQMRGLAKAPSFTNIDMDGDNRVSQQEFAAHQAQHRQQGMR